MHVSRTHFVPQTLFFTVQKRLQSICSLAEMLLQFIVTHRLLTQHLEMFVPQSAIVTHALFPTHCTYEAGGARVPTPPACKFSSTARADRQFIFPQLVPPLPKRPLFPTEDTTSWRGRVECTVRTVPRAPLSLTAPST